MNQPSAMISFHFSQLFDNDIVGLVKTSGPVVKLVLLLLLLFSLLSWGIILDKLLSFRKARRGIGQFVDTYRQFDTMEEIFIATTKLRGSPFKNIFRTGFKTYKEFLKKSEQTNPHPGLSNRMRLLLEREVAGVISTETRKLERRLIFLATTGSVTPFIGLFGTVWGIMNAFRDLSGPQGGMSLVTVAPGIAEALIATAAGLFAAIPAVIAFNYIGHKVKQLSADMQRFAAEFMVNLEVE
ncbi:MotA/TolQ/ExbB proton channel family protein [bacterium]|nr:MotA/TolQ/ExbB proton channel family protein [candidate division CSSED10-310 bacterium]